MFRNVLAGLLRDGQAAQRAALLRVPACLPVMSARLLAQPPGPSRRHLSQVGQRSRSRRDCEGRRAGYRWTSMVVSSCLPRRRRLLSPLALALTALALLAPSATSTATAAPPASGTRDAPVLLARAGAGTHSFSRGRTNYGSRRYGYGSRGYGSRGYGYRRSSGRSFLHGLFVGWTLSHFFGFGGGVPLFPLLFVMFIMYLMLRGGRRRPPRRGPWLQS